VATGRVTVATPEAEPGGGAAGGRAGGAPAAWLALAAVAVHARSLSGGFVWDDVYVVVTNGPLHDLSNLGRFFLDPATYSSSPGLVVYRPLRVAVHALVWAAFGPAPLPFHALNVALHAANAALVLAVARRLTRSDLRAGAVAALFAVHPLATEAVANVAGLSDVMYAAFWLGALALHLRALERPAPSWRDALAPSALFVPALLSKELAITLPVLATVLHAARGRRAAGVEVGWGSFAVQVAPLYALAAGFFVLRSALVGGLGAGEWEGGTFGRTMLMQADVLIRYLRLLVLPTGQSIRHCVEIPETTLALGALAPVAALAVLAAAALALRRRAPDVLAGLAWFFVCLLPVMNLVPLRGSMMGERFTYVAAIGAFLAASSPLAAAEAAGERARRAALAACLAAAGVLAILTFRRLGDWKDDVTIFESAVAVCPSSNPVRMILVREYERMGRPAEARAHYEAAVKNTLDARDRYRRIGAAALAAGDPREAAIWYRRATRMDPNDPAAREGLRRAEEAGRAP
jgi:tetratricopeptide (TPR) repeat protein